MKALDDSEERGKSDAYERDGTARDEPNIPKYNIYILYFITKIIYSKVSSINSIGFISLIFHLSNDNLFLSG